MTFWSEIKRDLRNNALIYVLIPIVAIGAATAVAAFRLHGTDLLDRTLHYACIVVPLTIISIVVRCLIVASARRT